MSDDRIIVAARLGAVVSSPSPADPTREEGEPNRCCENGYFGDGHACMKQPDPSAPSASPGDPRRELALILGAVALTAVVWWNLGPAAAGQCAVIATVLVVALTWGLRRE